MNSTMGKPYAVVTGASSGIGLELAKQFAKHGFDVLVTAEDDELVAAAEEVREFGTRVDTVRADLATEGGVDKLADEVAASGRPVAALALNAGVGAGGAFVGGTSLEDNLAVVDLNVRSSVHLAHRLLPPMTERGSGRVLFTSSVAATAPGPFQSVYNASKAFLKSFAEALREELRETGVTVTTLMPGPTETEFFDRADMLDTKVGAGDKDSAAVVAKQGYDALMAGEDHVVAGSPKNKVQAAAGNVLPDPAVARQHRRMSEPGSAAE
ncbi:SDR family oxidoreductase [Amycolatopsis sp. 195334CR]|uniref:SDR family NAD(P)-dependent oxidoreductase n=1 Tax=Amycolatopsis sp. 195334CR TaxID=2814588 RepID=UPI001A8DD54A|nr:SDR family NAD(P)-dependent oxidoreductase [Amycolatopsis sp. 195334CR]MBN6038392.1 SDR family NAD(P)-dependent oxidoreductase [Amycolatopsis sp. 195334CR]